MPLLQLNIVASALGSLAWLLALHLGGERGSCPWLLRVQVALGLLGNLLLLVPLAARLVNSPEMPGDPRGGLADWLTLLLALLPAVWAAGRYRWSFGRALLPLAGLAVGVLAGGLAIRWDDGHWLAFQTLASCWAAVALATGWLGGRQTQVWAGLVGGLLLLLAVRTLAGNFLVPWWAAWTVLTVSAAWAGVALRGRAEPWAFAAGLCANLAVTLVLLSNPLRMPEEVNPLVLVAANAAVAGLVALAWLEWRGRMGLEASAPGLLLGLQVLLAALGTLSVLANGFTLLVVSPQPILPLVPVAGPCGALALVPTVLVLVALRRQLPPEARGYMSVACALGGLIVIACWLAVLDRDTFLAYHALTAAPALLGFVLLLRPRLVELRPSAGVADAWIIFSAALLLVLGLRAVGVDPAGPSGPAATVLLAGLLMAGLALRQRREAWAFIAALLGNGAVSLLFYPFEDTPSALFRLKQFNVLASASAALLWLAAARRVTRTTEQAFEAPLLRLQAVLGLFGLVGPLLMPPAAALLLLPLSPGEAGPVCTPAGAVDVWATLLLAAAPAIWHVWVWEERSASLAHLAGVLGFAVGVLAGCTAARFDPWYAHRVLTFTWLAAGAVVLWGGWNGVWRHGVTAWVGFFVVLGLLLSLMSALTDPAGTGWAAAGAGAAGALAAGVAVWRRSDGWALTAGLCGNLAATLIVWGLKRTSIEPWASLLVQVNLATSAATTLIWALAARRLNDSSARQSLAAKRALASPLRTLQTSFLLAVQVILLLLAALAVFSDPDGPGPILTAVGGPWGWLALTLTTGAVLAHFGVPHRAELPALVGVSLLALGVQVSATVEVWQPRPWFAFHLLILFWADTALLLAALPWLLDRRPPTSDDIPMALPVPLAGDWQTWALPFAALSLLLALRCALVDPLSPWWAVGGVVSAAAVGALLALRRGQDIWAGAAGLCVNLAVTLALWRTHLEEPLTFWWLTLAQANVLAAAGVALVWLLAARRSGPGLPGGWLLTVQIGLALAGNAALLVGPVSAVISDPSNLPPFVAETGRVLGWLALLLTTAVAAWGARRTPGGLTAALLVGCGLGAGVLAACSAARWDHGHWLAYHVLMASWGLVAIFLGMAVLQRAEWREKTVRFSLSTLHF